MFLNTLRFTLLLGFVVVLLGAYTRLSDAGLGCPDWPGCYGRALVPETQAHIDQDNEIYAARPLEQSKAWKEMVHRYAAGLLGLSILTLAVWAWRRRMSGQGRQLLVPAGLLGLVIFQALLGMWTVTLQLKPLIVMGHLLGGMTILALLTWACLREQYRDRLPGHCDRYTRLAALALVMVYLQISLGGWTSANYAALICPDFPVCQGQWWPRMDFADAFIPWRGLGINYEYGVLGAEARTAIHVSHRIGALVTLAGVGAVACFCLRAPGAASRRCAAAVLAALICQAGLGVANILLKLPLAVAVAHNGVAAILLLSVTTLMFHCKNPAAGGQA